MNLGKLQYYFWLIISWSLLVHLPGLKSPLLDYQAYRQCQTASMARNYVRHGMHFLTPELDTEGRPERAGTEFPIYSFLLAILFKIGGLHEIWGRLLSTVFAAWGAWFLYGLARARLGDRVALWSALVMCALPIHVYFTRSVQPEPMALWGLLGFVYYLDRWLNCGGGIRDGMMACCLGSIAPLLKLPFLYVVAPLWFYLGWERWGWRLVGRLGFTTLLMGILGLTCTWYHYAKTAPVGVLPLTAQEHWKNLQSIFTWSLWRNHFISRLPELCLTYPGFLFAAVGTYVLHQARALRFWGVWFLATALYIVLLGDYGLIHRYTELPFAPINAVLIAVGIIHLWDQQKKWRWAVTLLVLSIPLHTGLRIAHWYRWEYPWVFQAHDALAQVSRPGDLVITNTREHPVLLYYLDHYGYAPDLEETGLSVIDAYRSQGARYFLTPTGESWARHPEWATHFAKNARLLHQDPDYLIYRLSDY